ncbi:stomatin-like protein 2, mitochondrial [Pempheris klunzingeri]|uniref:stomatin-like protein 2, mitochondrial n=1 Tax=Pempheris klunzingeri TaxID=3127111 RepID=UPI00397ED32C
MYHHHILRYEDSINTAKSQYYADDTQLYLSTNHITPVLQQLRWLPVTYRITYKILLLTFKALHNLAPPYLTELLDINTPSRTLRSSSSINFTIPPASMTTMESRAFSRSTPPPLELPPTRHPYAKTSVWVGPSSQGTVPYSWVSPAQQRRWASRLPMNTVVLFVPQQEAWVVQRMGRFHRILQPLQGLNFLIPILDQIRYVQSLKEIVIDIPEQSAVSLDNVTLLIDGVLYLRITDPFKASYGVQDPEYAVTQLAQTTMRSELGKLAMDRLFREREHLNSNIVHSINQASDEWGIRCLRYEIKDIQLPPRVKESMQMQVEAERRKRAIVLESEGTREAAINIAEGYKRAQILASEGEKAEYINKAAGEAQAVLAKAEAKSKAIHLLSEALAEENGHAAASLSVAEQYVSAFSKLARESNTVLLPSNTADVSGMVTQAMTIYSTLAKLRPKVEAIKTKTEEPNEKPPVQSASSQ